MSSSFFMRLNCLCFEINTDFRSSSSLTRGHGCGRFGVTTLLEDDICRDGVLGLDWGLGLHIGVLGRLLGTDLRCAGWDGVRGLLRGVWGRLDGEFGLWGQLDAWEWLGHVGIDAESVMTAPYKIMRNYILLVLLKIYSHLPTVWFSSFSDSCMLLGLPRKNNIELTM